MRTFLGIFFVILAFKLSAQLSSLERIRQLSDSEKHKEVIALSSSEIKKLKTTDSLYKKIITIRVYSYMALMDFKSAILDYNTLTTFSPKNTDYYNGLAYAYWALGNDPDCLISIHKAYEIDKKNVGTLSNMAFYYNEAGKFSQGLKFATSGLEQNPDQHNKATLLNNRGYSHIGLKEYELALKDINESAIILPDNSFVYYYRVLANIGLNKTETVCEDLKKCKSLGGDNLTAQLLPKYCN